jgi:hypothetical protein
MNLKLNSNEIYDDIVGNTNYKNLSSVLIDDMDQVNNFDETNFQKVKNEDAFSCFSAFFTMDGYRVCRKYWFIPKGQL